MHFCCAARFARKKGEVRAEDFLEGGFFQRKVFRCGNFFHILCLGNPFAHGFEPIGGVAFEAQDIFLRRPLCGHHFALALVVLVALDVLRDEQVRQAGDFSV